MRRECAESKTPYRETARQPALSAHRPLVSTATTHLWKDAGDSSSDVSKRTPSETMIFIIVGQLQFLTTLSTVDDIAEDDSFLSDFVNNLRYPCAACIDASSLVLATAGVNVQHINTPCTAPYPRGSLRIWWEDQQTPGGCVFAHAVTPNQSNGVYSRGIPYVICSTCDVASTRWCSQE